MKPKRIALSRPIAFVDLETTGRTVGVDRIVEIGVLKVTPNLHETSFLSRVNPEIPITSEATKLHGITNEDVKMQPTFKEIGPRLAAFMEGCDIAGYNILPFDVKMLESEFRRVGLPPIMEGRNLVDAMSIYVYKEPRDLQAAYKFYCGSEYAGEHSALADASAAWRILQGQLQKYPDLPNTPEELSAFIRQHDRSRFLDSGKWFHTRNGKPAFARGKYRGMLIAEVAEQDPEYIRWMFSTGVPRDTLGVIKGVLPNLK